MSSDAHDIEAEQAVLGAMLLSGEARSECLDLLDDRAFYRPAHQVICAAIRSLADEGKPADVLTVKAELERRGQIAACGGPVYLLDCTRAVPVAANGPWYARQLLGYQSQRDTAELSARVAQLGDDPGLSADERDDRIRAEVEKTLSRPAQSGPLPVGEILGETIDALERGEQRGLPTGLADLDDLTGGPAPGELVLVAARPGVGKSVLVTGFARHVAVRLGLPVLFASLEMSRQEITLRLISSTGRVPLHPLVQRNVPAADWPKIQDAGARLMDCPLFIDDTPGMTLAGLRARLRSMARTTPARMLVVDYLGLLDAPKAENRAQAVAGLSRGLKLIAREYGIPVVAAAQLNRRPEDRGDKIPQMSDLRDSGAQEQDADIVILLHREDAHDAQSPRAGEIDLIVAKNRQGPKATITAAFQGHYARIADMARIDSDWSPSSSLGGAA